MLFDVKTVDVGNQRIDFSQFNGDVSSMDGNMFSRITDLTARRAFLLVWPLSISLATPSGIIAKEQREWIRRKMSLVSRVTGSRSLAIVSS